ncbi:hypothetical protein IA54_013980 [Xanthomonas phaseoli pv. syngonii LMG 9055]|uniref:Uncharacterized protein n=1 Tax=Xanthomonas phaseoli pv. syngonii LMG 9055 TaxID=1437878 RepID=A0A1V9GS19_9XANT|nr:hypothetical protein IA54_013980 [Xanthomonas phaseoli pv. syngonii LMG 9055]
MRQTELKATAWHARIGPATHSQLTNPLARRASEACARDVGAIAYRDTLPSKRDGKVKRLHPAA